MKGVERFSSNQVGIKGTKLSREVERHQSADGPIKSHSERLDASMLKQWKRLEVQNRDSWRQPSVYLKKNERMSKTANGSFHILLAAAASPLPQGDWNIAPREWEHTHQIHGKFSETHYWARVRGTPF